MLSWAVRYLVVAVAVAALFAMLQGQGSHLLELAARDAGGDGAERRARHAPADRDHEADSEADYDADAADDAEADYYDTDAADDTEAEADDDTEAEADTEEAEAEADTEEAEAEDDSAGDLEQIIEAGPGGHFLLKAVVNGVPINFMVDTGASHVVLTIPDARRIGFTANDLEFTQEFESANGTVRAAPVKLRELRIGQFSVYGLEASVNGGPLPISLLGMNFLQHLSSYEVADGRLILRW
jgi:clan AA aspartic protease (TIGR02281 family)